MKKILLLALSVLVVGCATQSGSGESTVQALRNDRTDRLTTASSLTDRTIAFRVNRLIREVLAGTNSEVQATVFNQRVLLTGVANSEVEKQRVIGAVRQVESVRFVISELKIAAPRSASEVIEDRNLAASVLSKIDSIPDFGPSSVRVVTYQRGVYLMGALFSDEVALVTSTASRVQGVSRVVNAIQKLDAKDDSPAVPAVVSTPPVHGGGSAPASSGAQTQTERIGAGGAARVSFEEAVKKCTELGFKPQTEKHGDCVLRLSK